MPQPLNLQILLLHKFSLVLSCVASAISHCLEPGHVLWHACVTILHFLLPCEQNFSILTCRVIDLLSVASCTPARQTFV